VEAEARRAKGNRTPGRPHIARVLVSKGVATSIPDAFAHFLSDEVLALDKWSLDIERAVRLIHEAGGVAVLAHPLTLKLDPVYLEMELMSLLQKGVPLRGLEVYSSRHDAETAAQFLRIAHTLGLIPTGGSDYHGRNKANVPFAVFGGTAAINGCGNC
jgi:3',5'-nucleoside bisphosphate phosphatase